jgi:sarcosine oxidase subunit beta
VSTKVLLCRCEDVTLGDALHAAELGYRDIEEVKRYTGLGTGPCGGKECMALCARVLSRYAAANVDAKRPSPQMAGTTLPRPFTARPPVHTVSLGTLAARREGKKGDR